jgi:endoglucanase
MQKGILKAFIGVFVLVVSIQAGPVTAYGDLYVDGNRIKGKTNQAVQIRGMSLFWSQWQGYENGNFWNPWVVDWLVSDWKIDVIRGAVGVNGYTDGYLDNPAQQLQRMNAVAGAAIDNDIYFIADWHSHDAYTTQAVDFFRQMATSYGHLPNIIYEIFNEPDNESWSQVKSHANTVIAAIRAIDPNNLIIVGTPDFSKNVDEASRDKVSGTNIAYAVHFYAATHRDDLRSKVTTALNNGVAIFASEWGTTGWDGGQGSYNIDQGSSDAWLSFLDQNKISWCNWSVFNKQNEGSSALKHYADPQTLNFGNWTSSDLTTSGTYVRNKLRAAAPTYPPKPSSSSAAVSSSSSQPLASSSSNQSGTSSGGATLVGDTWVLPGKIEAEDAASSNGVQFEASQDGDGTEVMSHIDNGDWATYKIQVPVSGSYTFQVRYATSSYGGDIQIMVGATTVSTITLVTTGSWASYATSTVNLNLTAGTHTLRLNFIGRTGLFNLNWINFISNTPIPVLPDPVMHTPQAYYTYKTIGPRTEVHLQAGHPYTRIKILDAGGRLVSSQVVVKGEAGVHQLEASVWNRQFIRMDL